MADRELLLQWREALTEARRAIGDHCVPEHCYATGPMTGDSIRDLVECPACSFLAMYEPAMASLSAALKPPPGPITYAACSSGMSGQPGHGKEQ